MITTTHQLEARRSRNRLNDELVQELRELLADFDGEETLREIFWSVLAYEQKRLPMSMRGVSAGALESIIELELFAAHDEIGVVRVECANELTRPVLESLSRHLDAQFAGTILLVHERCSDQWTIVCPDRTLKHLLRLLPIPGADLDETARAVASLATVDWDSEEEFRRFDVAERMDTFFPGETPKERWEFDPAFERLPSANGFQRQKAAPLADLYRDIAQLPLLTRHQELGLDLDEFQEDVEELDEYRSRLVTHNMRLVVNIALKYPTSRLPIEDIVQEGMLGLIRAAQKYEPSRGCRFSTYAWYWINQSILRAFEQNQNLIRWPAHRVRELRCDDDQDLPTDRSPGERPVVGFDGSEEVMESHLEPLNDWLADVEQGEAVREAVHRLHPRMARVVALRFGLGDVPEMTLEEVGAAEGVTRERIRQIQVKAMVKLRNTIPSSVQQEWTGKEVGDAESE